MAHVAVAATLQWSRPSSERVLVIEDTLDLASVARVLNAAFGFSGETEGLFVRPAAPPLTTEAVVFAAAPDESVGEESLTRTSFAEAVGPFQRGLDYHYGSSTDWVVSLQPLGPSTDRGSHPARLVTATGPDALEEFGSPRLMSMARDQAILALAGAGSRPDEVDDPHVLLARLSTCDEQAIARRLKDLNREP